MGDGCRAYLPEAVQRQVTRPASFHSQVLRKKIANSQTRYLLDCSSYFAVIKRLLRRPLSYHWLLRMPESASQRGGRPLYNYSSG